MKRIEKHLDVKHHPELLKLVNSIDDTEKAFLSKDVNEIVRVYDKVLPAAKKLLPEFKHPRLRAVFADTIKHVEELVAKLKSADNHFDHVNEFLRKILAQSTILLKEVLVDVA